jgi:hypothetical protein
MGWSFWKTGGPLVLNAVVASGLVVGLSIGAGCLLKSASETVVKRVAIAALLGVGAASVATAIKRRRKWLHPDEGGPKYY